MEISSFRKRLSNGTDGGGNSCRNRLWKLLPESLADKIGSRWEVCHSPPGASKWNTIQHRFYVVITNNWRGRPMTSLRAIVSLFASTSRPFGLAISAALDPTTRETKINVTDERPADPKVTRHEFHGEWNYTIAPNQ